MTIDTKGHIADLMTFLDASPVNFLAAETVMQRLDEAGYKRLEQNDRWNLRRGGRYYITKNGSAVFAFIVGSGDASDGFRIISAHSDSPGFRIKPRAAIRAAGDVIKLNTEVYGGPILYTWFDRPLSIAGRVIVRGKDIMHPEAMTVKFDRPLLTIPHLAIHFNRSVNEGNPLSKQKDMLPVIAMAGGCGNPETMLPRLIAERLGISIDDIVDFDLSLYDTTPACLVGLDGEFISAGRLDDLSMVYSAMTALIESDTDCAQTRVMAVFDNEETGSGTKQGAASPELANMLMRISSSLGADAEDHFRAVANSFMISADNAHGVHPNYVEKQDPTNHPHLGGGPVIKINANCKYMTDADSSAVYSMICERAGVPCQYFVNHSDSAGGSTLGNILTSQIPLRGVDMGAAIWAMHSVRETASVADHEYIIASFKEFFK